MRRRSKSKFKIIKLNEIRILANLEAIKGFDKANRYNKLFEKTLKTKKKQIVVQNALKKYENRISNGICKRCLFMYMQININ